MAESKQNISIRIANLLPIQLKIDPQAEASIREAEGLVNSLWQKWMNMFGNNCSSEEVMARVAFQFARLYADAKRNNDSVNSFLTKFEEDLNELVVKI